MFEYERVRVEGDVGWSETERDVRQRFTVREKRRSQIGQKSHDDDDYDNKETRGRLRFRLFANGEREGARVSERGDERESEKKTTRS